MPFKIITSLAVATLIGLNALFTLAIPSSVAAATGNLIANSSVETPDSSNSSLPQSWSKGGWGTNQSSYNYLNSGQDGSRSIQVKVSSYTSGDAKWYFNPVTVQANTQYNFSDYYQSTVVTGVVAQFDDGNGHYTYQDLGSAAASSSWKQYSATFTAPASAVHVTVFHLINSLGTLTTDNFSLTGATDVTPPPPPPATDNLIANSSVETVNPSNSSLPQSWSKEKRGTNKTTYSYLSSGQDGKRSVRVKITNYTSGDAKWYFDPVNIRQDTQYTFSDYYTANVQTSVIARFDDGNGHYTYQDLGSAAASSSWKQYSATFTAPASAVHVTVFHLLNKAGVLTTDNFSLTGSTITPPPPPPPATDNLIANSSVETPDPLNSNLPQSWRRDSWGTNTASYSYLNEGYDGNRSMQVKLSNYVSGDAKWYFDPVTVQADTQYAFSDYYKSTVQTEVDAVFTMTDGSTIYQIIGQPDTSGTWQKFSTEFSIPQGAVNVTVYHFIKQVGTLTTDNYSLKSYTPVGFNRAVVSLTFDDGYASTYDNGLPILQKYGFVSTQFIVSGLVGQSSYMSQAEVKALHTKGHEIASHTVSHPDLTKDSATQLAAELSQSQNTLQNWIGEPVTNLAYPYGLYNSAVLNATQQYYGAARGVEDGLNGKDNFNLYDIRVQNIFNTTTTAQVADWVYQAQQTKTWLVLVYHSVDTSSNPYGGIADNVTPAQLDAQLAALKSSSVTVETMQQALQELTSQL